MQVGGRRARLSIDDDGRVSSSDQSPVAIASASSARQPWLSARCGARPAAAEDSPGAHFATAGRSPPPGPARRCASPSGWKAGTATRTPSRPSPAVLQLAAVVEVVGRRGQHRGLRGIERGGRGRTRACVDGYPGMPATGRGNEEPRRHEDREWLRFVLRMTVGSNSRSSSSGSRSAAGLDRGYGGPNELELASHRGRPHRSAPVSMELGDHLDGTDHRGIEVGQILGRYRVLLVHRGAHCPARIPLQERGSHPKAGNVPNTAVARVPIARDLNRVVFADHGIEDRLLRQARRKGAVARLRGSERAPSRRPGGTERRCRARRSCVNEVWAPAGVARPCAETP